MSLRIEQEKSIADAILERLEIIDPTCILAGGAPRDWWMGTTANDLDFYIHCNRTSGDLENSLKCLGLPVTAIRQQAYNVRDQQRLDNLYNTMPDLRAVYQTEYRGKKVQIMAMNRPTFQGVVDQFAVSISKVWYKRGRIYPEQAAQHSLDTNQIIVAKGYGPNCNYVRKMKERFPTFSFLYVLDGGLRAHEQPQYISKHPMF